MFNTIRLSMIALVLSAIFSPCHSSVVYNEAADGDLSTSFLSPTTVAIHNGSNQIFGTTGRVAGVVDRDYFTITLTENQFLVSLTVLPGTTGDNTGTLVSFIGVNSGATGIDPTTAQIPLANGLLGYHLFGPADIDQDILDNMSSSNLLFVSAQGFTTPLGKGTYTFWVQETVNTVNYGFDLKVIPEPESLMLISIGFVGVFFSRRRHY